MPQADPAGPRAHEEASSWFVRLKRRQVSLTDIEAFRRWRQDPDNRAAYERVDDAWRRADAMGDATARQAVSEALQRGGKRRARRQRRIAWATGAAAAITAVVVAGGVELYWAAHPSYVTQVGEQRLLKLADGSAVRLDTATRIDVALSSASRRIRLEHGQAFFEVAHDPARPFVVTAGPLTVRAVGTKFDVRADGPDPTVTLVDGVVEVSRAGAQPRTWTLRPGQQLVATTAAAPRRVDIRTATSWTSGRVVFEDVPLSAAIEEINRYASHKIVLRAPRLATTPVSGSFETGDVAAFIAAESDLHGLRATPLADGRIALDAVASTGT